MNEEASSQVDPFSPAVLDEATELRALSRALELGKDFKLIFVRCNQADQRRSLIQKARGELPSLNIQEIRFSEPVTHLLDALRGKIQRPVPDVLFVYGLEYSLPSAAEAHRSPLVANLNASRNSFPDAISCPLVLWVPEYTLNAIMLGAPDFFSIRSGVYYFAAGPRETSQLVQSLMAGHEGALEGLTLEEKTERVKAIQSLLADYESLPVDKRDPAAEMRLRLRLGNLSRMLGAYDDAAAYFERARDQAKTHGDSYIEGAATSGLGIVYRYLGNWADARVAFERSLDLSRQLGNRGAEAMDLRNIGNLDVNLGNIEKARGYYQQSLKIIRELGDKNEESAALINLAGASYYLAELSEAEELLKDALRLAETSGNRSNEQYAFQTLGNIYSDEGRLSEAEDAYQKSWQIAQELGDPEGKWKALTGLSVLRERQGDLRGAKDFVKRSIEVLKQIKGKELEYMLSRLADLERKTKEQEEARQQPV